jgi:hypothetical protein
VQADDGQIGAIPYYEDYFLRSARYLRIVSPVLRIAFGHTPYFMAVALLYRYPTIEKLLIPAIKAYPIGMN